MTQPLALVIDDNDVLGRAFALALEHTGFAVTYINDARTALAAIERIRPDVIVLDVNMPQVSGIEILKTLRQTPSIVKTRVIIVTAGSAITHDEEVNALADLVLLKPVSLSQIINFANRFVQETSTPPADSP
jgi:two-component system cell cycle response regulator DivK